MRWFKVVGIFVCVLALASFAIAAEKNLGIRVLTGKPLENIAADAGGVRGSFGDETLEADLLLCAVGRKPVTEGLALENAGHFGRPGPFGSPVLAKLVQYEDMRSDSFSSSGRHGRFLDASASNTNSISAEWYAPREGAVSFAAGGGASSNSYRKTGDFPVANCISIHFQVE